MARVKAFIWLLPLLIALGIYASFASLSLELGSIFSDENRAQMAQYIAQFFPPDTSSAHLTKVWRGTLETLAISIVGTLLAALLGFLIALPAAGRFGAWLRAPARLLLNFFRSIHELVWAALLVFAAGLGPFAGTLALAIHTAGVLGRLFAETFENTPDHAARALREGGAGATAAFLYGTLPTVWPQLIAYTLYRWENNIRASAVLGVVGAGGLGQMLHFHLSLFQQPQALTVIIAMIALVLLVEGVSVLWRGRLAR